MVVLDNSRHPFHSALGRDFKNSKFDINDLRLLFHCYILIPRKCPGKTPFKTQWGGGPETPIALPILTALWNDMSAINDRGGGSNKRKFVYALN